ncbi:MAG: hypothetical protein MJ051_08145 [Akkermansia sp.]|nr:hypothetical protein [Akkermansia sp.]
MKKTLVALFALGSMAMAGDISYTIDNAWSLAGDSELHSSVEAALANNGDALNLNRLNNVLNGSDHAVTVTLSDMYWSVVPATVENRGMLLTSVQIVSRNDAASQLETALTVSFGGHSYTSATADYSGVPGTAQRGLITFNFNTPVDITGAEALTLTLSGAGTGGTVFQAKNEGFELHGDTATNGLWHAGIRLNVQTPEPATATLSLLALAGLAARRRRH